MQRIFSKFSDGIANKAFVDDHDRLWRLPMAQRMTLAVFEENSERILALNVNYVATKDDIFHQELDAKVLNVFK